MQRTYVDGAFDAERPTKAKPGINDLNISIGQGNNQHQLIGMNDEVRISSIALPEAEIKQSVETGLAPVEARANLL